MDLVTRAVTTVLGSGVPGWNLHHIALQAGVGRLSGMGISPDGRDLYIPMSSVNQVAAAHAMARCGTLWLLYIGLTRTALGRSGAPREHSKRVVRVHMRP